jgi:hypothetical protein|nr:MAG TPA: hypothetical protein [Caudoviricetes sp.]
MKYGIEWWTNGIIFMCLILTAIYTVKIAFRL